MRIAVLDNDRSQSDLICQVLGSVGHTCHGYQTAKDTLHHLRKDSYDMLILDWQVVDLGAAENGAEQLQFGQYLFETRPGRLLMDGTVLDVTQKEFALALLFFRNIGRPLSRAYIHEAVWVKESAVPSRTMDTHVSRVRNKLVLKPENGYRLVPVYSYGYRLEKLGG
eukprot:gene14900-14697_t